MPKHWITSDGDRIRFSDMTDDHLRRVLKLLKRNVGRQVAVPVGSDPDDFDVDFEEWSWMDLTAEEWLIPAEEEARKRGFNG